MDTLELVEAEAEPGELEFVTGASARSRLVKVIMSEESFKSLGSQKNLQLKSNGSTPGIAFHFRGVGIFHKFLFFGGFC